jgi:hypothetical protein
MANFKVTIFYEGVQQAGIGASGVVGWTETWYLGGVAVTLDQSFSHFDLTNYLQLRRACLLPLYRIAWVRISDEFAPRSFKIWAPNQFIGQAALPSGMARGQVQCALLVDFARLPQTGVPGEPTHHKKFLLRALPADVIDGNIINTSGVNWPNFQTFLNWIGNHPTATPPQINNVVTNMGLRFHDPNFPSIPGVNVLLGTPTVNQLAIQPDQAALAIGSRVSVRGVAAPYQKANRIWTVLAHANVGGVLSTICGTTRKPVVTSLAVPATIQPVKYLYGVASQYTIIGLRSKRTGRIFRQLRGRSSNRP